MNRASRLTCPDVVRLGQGLRAVRDLGLIHYRATRHPQDSRVVGVILCLIEALRQRDSIGPRPRIFRWRATVGTPSGWHDTAIRGDTAVEISESDAVPHCRRRGNRPTDGRRRHTDYELTCVEPESPMGELLSSLLATGLHLRDLA